MSVGGSQAPQHTYPSSLSSSQPTGADTIAKWGIEIFNIFIGKTELALASLLSG